MQHIKLNYCLVLVSVINHKDTGEKKKKSSHMSLLHRVPTAVSRYPKLSSLYQLSNAGEKMRLDGKTCLGSIPHLYCLKEIINLEA